MASSTAAAGWRSTFFKSVSLDLRSTRLTMAWWWCWPMIVSASHSPMRRLVATTLGRSALLTHCGMWPLRS